MELLKNKKAFEDWKKGRIHDGDVAEDPLDFPCFVTSKVLRRTCQHEEAVYFYRSNLAEMLSMLDGN